MIKEKEEEIFKSSHVIPPPQRYVSAKATLLEKQLTITTDEPRRIEILLDLARELKAANPARALALAEEAGRLCENFFDTTESLIYRRYSAMSLCLIGFCYYYLSDFGAAHAISDQAVILFDELHQSEGKALATAAIGYVFQRLGKFEQSAAYFQQSLKLYLEGDQKAAVIELYVALGRLYTEIAAVRQQPPLLAQAANYLHSARDYAESLDSKQLLALAYFALSETYKAMGNFRKALEYHEEFARQWDIFLSVENELRIYLIEEQFSSEREKQASEIYQLKTVELAEAQEELKLLIEALQQSDVRQTQLLSELAQKNAELERLSKEDALTGLYNRRHIDYILGQEFHESRVNNQRLTVGILDLDHFKKINDNFSHQVGDEVLKITAQIIKTRIGREGIAGRYGGEEFVIVFPRASLERAALVSDTVRRSVEVYEWSSIHPELKVTLSMGLCSDMSFMSYEKMIAFADEKLYEAKKNGRNQVRY